MLFKIAIHIPEDLRPFLPRIKYALDFVQHHPAAAGSNLTFWINPDHGDFYRNIHYGSQNPLPGHHFLLPANNDIIGLNTTFSAPTVLNQFDCKSRDTYEVSPFKNTGDTAFLKGNRYGFDWISTLFFHLSRIEEYAAKTRDEIGLMTSDSQVICRYNLHFRPLADELVQSVLESFGITPKAVISRVSTSCDVDKVTVFGTPVSLVKMMFNMKERYGKPMIPCLLRDYSRTKSGLRPDPGNNFSALFREQENGPVNVYFGAGFTHPNDRFPSFNRSEMRSLKKMAQEGKIIPGFHPGFDTWKNPEEWVAQLHRLQNWLDLPVRHTRQHFLRLALPDTLKIIEQAGMETDSSIGYRDRIGFRAGTGFPFHLYNFEDEKPYSWKEIPLVLMDVAWLREGKYKQEKMRHILHRLKMASAHLTDRKMLFHNTIFYEQELGGLPLWDLYRESLQ